MTGVKQWITLNGNHIPIYDGESKQDAVNRFIAKEKSDTRDRQIAKNKEQADKLNHKDEKDAPIPVEKSIYTTAPNEHGGRGLNMDEQMTRFNKDVVASDNQLTGLKKYAAANYEDKDKFAKEHQLEELIEANPRMHLGGAKLFRGGYVDDSEYADILSGKSTNFMRGLTSWSLREDVAHMYAQGDPFTGEIFGGREAKGGHRVIFVEDNTDDSFPVPYTYPQEETIRGKRHYDILKIVKESEYSGKVSDGDRSSAHSGFDKPVTYVFVRSWKDI